MKVIIDIEKLRELNPVKPGVCINYMESGCRCGWNDACTKAEEIGTPVAEPEPSPGQQIMDALPKEMFEASGMIAKFIEELLTANPYSTPENAIGYRRGLEEVEKRLPELFAEIVKELRKRNPYNQSINATGHEGFTFCCNELKYMLEEKP